MSGTRAAVLIYEDRPHPDKQRAAVIDYAERNGIQIVALCRRVADCISLVATRAANLILAAYDDGDPGYDIEAAGGRFIAVRDAVESPRVRREVAPLVQRMTRRGLAVSDIADILEVTTSEIRRLQRTTRRVRPGARAGW